LLSDQELLDVQEVSNQITRQVTLRVNAEPSDLPFQRNLVNVARQVAGVSMNKVILEESYEAVVPGRPSITLASGNYRNIHYLAAPEGPEFQPFLEALAWLGQAKPVPETDGQTSLSDSDSPVEVLVLLAAACPHCPKVVRRVLSLATSQPLLTVILVDVLQYSDLAERYVVRSTPTLVINDGATLVGDVSEEEILRAIIASGDPDSLTTVLRAMIDAGRAEDAAALMRRRRQPRAILPLYRSQEFSVRMGALVALEAALEQDPRSLDPIVEDLTTLLSEDDVALRGDTAELLGKIGDVRAADALRKAAEDPDPDVREAAVEALELLESDK
jgi:alkyl hydroperoxide reductase subunit AhpF